MEYQGFELAGERFRLGDHVLVRPGDAGAPLHVARLLNIRTPLGGGARAEAAEVVVKVG